MHLSAMRSEFKTCGASMEKKRVGFWIVSQRIGGRILFEIVIGFFASERFRQRVGSIDFLCTTLP